MSDITPTFCGLTAEEILQLKQRNAELAAQVEQLRLAALNAISFMAGGEAKAQLRDAYDAAPTQCLAEHDREVAARAVSEAMKQKYIGCVNNWGDIEDNLKSLRSKIKSGEVEI